MTQNRPKIIITGSGSLSRCISFMLASCVQNIDVVLASRNLERLRWITSASRAKQEIHKNSSSFEFVTIDWSNCESLECLISTKAPDIVIHTASIQSPWLLSGSDRWSQLVKAVGFGLTTALHGKLLYRLLKAVKNSGSKTKIINACYPDALNPIFDSFTSNTLVGMGNIAIIASLLKSDKNFREKDIQIIASHYDVARLIRDLGYAKNLNVWADGRKIAVDQNVFPILPVDSELNWITAASVIPQIMSLIDRDKNYKGHIPGVLGLPGGYPVLIREGKIKIDLPKSIELDTAVAGNRQSQMKEGISVSEMGIASYSEMAVEKIRNYSRSFPVSFKADEIESAANELIDLRSKLM